MQTFDATTPGRHATLCTFLDHLAAAAPQESGAPGRLVSLEEAPGRDYLLGALDMLACLGAVQLSDDGMVARAVSPPAGWALRIFSDVIDHGGPLVADWCGGGLSDPAHLRHPFARAADLLAALDRRRFELLPGAAPVREIAAAVGLIPRVERDGRLAFLLAYDRAAGAWQLPGGRCAYADCSPRHTLLRELAEELLLSQAQLDALDLIPIDIPLKFARDSPTYGLHSCATFSAFLVLGAPRLPADGAQLGWFGEGELGAGRAADGRRIDVAPLLKILAERGPDLRALVGRGAE